MRVLFVSYDHPLTGRSGVSVYSRALFRALREHRVSVDALYIAGLGWRGAPSVHVSQEQGITLLAVSNSPLRPEQSLHHPQQDVRQAALSRVLEACLRRHRPDLVHVQTLHGFPGSLLSTARDLGIPTVVMLHDFWAICPRIGLTRVQGDACDGPDEGRNCVRFCVRPPSLQQRVFQFGIVLPNGPLKGAFLAARSLYLRARRRPGAFWLPPATPPRTGGDGRLQRLHGERAAALLQALADADQLIAVSDFVRSVFVRHGIPSERITTLTPVPAGRDRLVRRDRAVPAGPLRFGYLGRVVPMKGAHVFAEAARGVPPGKARFLLFGAAPPETVRHLQGLAGDTPLEFMGPYGREALQRVLDQVDVVVVPSVVQETVALPTLEAQAAGVPVVASRIGATPEFVRDGENGLLFRPGDPSDLREKLLRLIEAPRLVHAFSTRARPPLSLADHVHRLLDVYAACRSPSGQRAAP